MMPRRPPEILRSLETLLALWDELRATPGPHQFVMRGSSMWPAVPDGSVLEVHPCSPTALRPGQMVTFRRLGTVVTHRVMSITPRGEVIAWGDSLLAPDEPIPARDVLGEARLVRSGSRRDQMGIRILVRRLLAGVHRL